MSTKTQAHQVSDQATQALEQQLVNGTLGLRQRMLTLLLMFPGSWVPLWVIQQHVGGVPEDMLRGNALEMERLGHLDAREVDGHLQLGRWTHSTSKTITGVPQ